MTLATTLSQETNIDELLEQLKTAYKNYSEDSQFYKIGEKISSKAPHLIYSYMISRPATYNPVNHRKTFPGIYLKRPLKLKKISKCDEIKLKEVLISVIKVLNNPNDAEAILVLEGLSKRDYPKDWNLFLSVIAILVSTALLALFIATAFFTCGTSLSFLVVIPAVLSGFSSCAAFGFLFNAEDPSNRKMRNNLNEFITYAKDNFFSKHSTSKSKVNDAQNIGPSTNFRYSVA